MVMIVVLVSSVLLILCPPQDMGGLMVSEATGAGIVVYWVQSDLYVHDLTWDVVRRVFIMTLFMALVLKILVAGSTFF